MVMVSSSAPTKLYRRKNSRWPPRTHTKSPGPTPIVAPSAVGVPGSITKSQASQLSTCTGPPVPSGGPAQALPARHNVVSETKVEKPRARTR